MDNQSHTNVPVSYRILPLAALRDNYIWLLRHDPSGTAMAVDPGEAQVLLDYLQRENLQLAGILVTHHHADHVGGIAALRRRFPAVRVHGPAAEAIDGLDERLTDGAVVEFPQAGAQFQVLSVPGHTLGHLAYYDRNHPDGGVLLSGDTLFSAGCGRIFEGTAAQMQHSLARLRALPAETRVYCAHEYTAANLRFAQAVESDNAELAEHAASVEQLRAAGQPSLPSTLALERRINPFLRWDEPSVQQAAASFLGREAQDRPLEPMDAVAVFAAIRAWKDAF